MGTKKPINQLKKAAWTTDTPNSTPLFHTLSGNAKLNITYHRVSQYSKIKTATNSKAPRHFNIFGKELNNMNRNNLRKATQILTGHAQLNYHLNKYNKNIPTTCEMCGYGEETVGHFISSQAHAQDQMVASQGETLNTYFSSFSDIIDHNKLIDIINFANKTKRMEYIPDVPNGI